MKNLFDKIKLSQLFVLYTTLARAQVRDVANIKRKYSDAALAFDETLALLEELKLIKNNSGELSLKKISATANISIDEFKNEIVPILFSANDEISEQLRKFLINFQMQAGIFSFKATELEKVEYSDTRNLLLELEFILVDLDNSTYLINPAYTDLFIKQFSRKKISVETLKKKQLENETIGLEAERAVIEFEINRLTNISFERKEIEHISEENAAAGYDIKSFENYLDNNFKKITRYIEVKAVSPDNYDFFWSKNEINIAKILSESYYLYLLPVVSSNTFDFEKLLIKNNPYKNVYQNEQDWTKQEELIRFSKKP